MQENELKIGKNPIMTGGIDWCHASIMLSHLTPVQLLFCFLRSIIFLQHESPCNRTGSYFISFVLKDAFYFSLMLANTASTSASLMAMFSTCT
jgi:hypothetical protein